ncbi:hypothetical protein BDV19DRAFT_354765 [Aspergillus venezuelensis]
MARRSPGYYFQSHLQLQLDYSVRSMGFSTCSCVCIRSVTTTHLGLDYPKQGKCKRCRAECSMCPDRSRHV